MERASIRLCFAILALFAAPMTPAPEVNWGRSLLLADLYAQTALEPGTPVRITPIQGRRLEGELLRISPEEVVVLVHGERESRERSLVPEEIRFLEVGVDGERNFEGTVVGYTAVLGAVGALVGGLAAPCTERRLFGCVERDPGRGALKGAAIGGAVGLAAGILMSRRPIRRWEPADLPSEGPEGRALEVLLNPRIHLEMGHRGRFGLAWTVPVGGR
jgi:hypothetical protein